MKANRPAEAADAYERAMRLDPVKSGMLQVGYGQALLATGKPENVRSRSRCCRRPGTRPQNVSGYQYLAQAYGQLGDGPEAELALAEGHFTVETIMMPRYSRHGLR